MKRLFYILIIFPVTFLYSLEADIMIGQWQVENVSALQIIQIYTDGYDHFSNAYLIREEFLDDPLTYVSFNFIDEDLLYIKRADGTSLRGFYQIRENSGINREEYPYYIFLEDKFANTYSFPVKEQGEGIYLINYSLEMSLRDQLMQISCIARLKKEAQ